MAKNPDEDQSYFTNFKGFVNHDYTEDDVDLNPQEESRLIVSDASAASSSTIDEANKKTDSSSSTGEKNKKKFSANAKPWNLDDFIRPDDETSSLVVTQPSNQNPNLSLPQVMMPRRELGHSVTQPLQQNPNLSLPQVMMPRRELGHSVTHPLQQNPNLSLPQVMMPRRELGHSVTQPLQQNPWCNQFPWYHQPIDPQWQWQLSPFAALWIPHNISQSPMLYPAFALSQYRIYVPWRPYLMPPLPIPMMLPMTNEDQQRMAIMMMMFGTTCRVGNVTMPLFRTQTGTQESDVGSSSQYGRDQEQPRLSNQENLYQHPIANQENLYRHPMANHENIYQHPMANHENLHQHQMANQENLYQHPMANQENLYRHQMANHENLHQHQMANQENLYQHPMANQDRHQMANRLHLYQQPMANQENQHQQRMANQENLYQHPMSNEENLYRHHMANHENLHQHQMANQENLYQHPMANQDRHQMANRLHLYQQPMANQENQHHQRMDIMRMLETHCRLGDGTIPQFRRELFRQRVLQLEHQTEQPTETQGPDTGSSSQYGGGQEQPK